MLHAGNACRKRIWCHNTLLIAKRLCYVSAPLPPPIKSVRMSSMCHGQNPRKSSTI